MRGYWLVLLEIIALDKIQKQQSLNDDEIKLLRAKSLIEGRKPNYYIAKSIAKETGQKASYSRNKAFDKQYYLDLIHKSIEEHGYLTRKDADELLWNKLPEWMSNEQKKNKVSNLLGELRQKGKIKNQGSKHKSVWVLG